MALVATKRTGGGAQLRVAKGAWTPARRKAFLAELADTMNVRRSAQRVGLTPQGAYKARKRDAAFALGWAEALSIGYERVEMLLLERAIASLGGDTVEPGEGEGLAKLSERTLIALLTHHRQTVRAHRGDEDDAAALAEKELAARAALAAKMDEMLERIAGEAGDAG